MALKRFANQNLIWKYFEGSKKVWMFFHTFVVFSEYMNFLDEYLKQG